MRLILLVSALAVLTSSCAHQRQAKTPVPRAILTRSAMERQVINAIDAGDGDYTVRSLRDQMAAHPDNLDVRLELAKAYHQRGYPELALDHYRLAAARFPESNTVQLKLAKSLREFGMLSEAAQGLETFLQQYPEKLENVELAAWLGILRDELGEWQKGESAHRAALALNPELDYLHNNLGYNLLMQGKDEEAAKHFRSALRLRPDSLVARNNLGMALANTPEEAVLHWQSVSDPASAHNNLGAWLIEQRRYNEARKELDLALGYNKNHPAALNNLRLVSQLDGKPAFIPVRPVETRGSKWKAAVRRAISGEREQRNQDSTAVHTARNHRSNE